MGCCPLVERHLHDSARLTRKHDTLFLSRIYAQYGFAKRDRHGHATVWHIVPGLKTPGSPLAIPYHDLIRSETTSQGSHTPIRMDRHLVQIGGRPVQGTFAKAGGGEFAGMREAAGRDGAIVPGY